MRIEPEARHDLERPARPIDLVRRSPPAARTEAIGTCRVRRSHAADTLLVVAAWTAGIGLSGSGHLHLNLFSASSAVIVALLIAVTPDRPRGLPAISRCVLAHGAFAVVLVAAVAWYVAVRGSLLIIELALPTLAVWILFQGAAQLRRPGPS